MSLNGQKSVFKNYKDNSSGIIEEEIINFIPLVKKVVNRLIMSGIPKNEYEDLIDQGVIGLINAYLNYDPGKNVKFETYASIRIRGEILDYLRSKDWIPRNLRKKFKDLLKIENYLDEDNNDIDTICNKLDISKDEYYKLQTQIIASNVSSLDEIIENNFISISSVDNIPEKEILINDEKRILKESIDSLNEREKLIITLYYYEELSLKDISHILNISESRVSQIHTRALLKLKQQLENYYIT
ncbi:MAG: FliA/WhiG family RNA polymerase sigma factor [Thermoanaerobacteraceae bacterium]|nr:FliA/WhiG family RNA polymerase sigma factor [Thermoanaerobacteraceae bacterium]